MLPGAGAWHPLLPFLSLAAASVQAGQPPAQVGPQPPPLGCRPVHMRGRTSRREQYPGCPPRAWAQPGCPLGTSRRCLVFSPHAYLPRARPHPRFSEHESLWCFPLPPLGCLIARSAFGCSRINHHCSVAQRLSCLARPPPPLPPLSPPHRRRPAGRGAEASGGAAPVAGQPGRPPGRAPALPGGVVWAHAAAAGLLAALRLPPRLPAADAQRRDG